MKNYFEIFEIPVQLKVSKEKIKQKYFALSRQTHPDYFIHQSEEEQQQALEKSALLNKAWKTFNDSDATIGYVLSLKGLITENEKYELPPPFLMQMLELNEELAEALLSGEECARARMMESIQQTENEIYEPVKSIIEHYQEGVDSEEALLRVKDYYFKKKYIERLKLQFN